MRKAVFIMAALAAVGSAPVMAQGTQFDAALAYTARDEIVLPGQTEKIDNDIARLTAGLSWGAGDGRMRAALELGFGNNNNWNGDYPANYGGELVFARKVGNQRYGLGARLRTLEDLSTTTEIAYAIEHIGNSLDLRGLVGMQLIADETKVPGRDASGFFVQGEATVYASDSLALSAGLLADSDGEAYGAGVEYRPSGWGMSFFLEYSEAFDDYRGFASYDEFAGGIRIVPGTSSLKSQRQGGLGRIMQRYMEAQ
ncbi:hypothetical protein DKT77_02555 [Meridianimarinicoccus roseus]|uniref:Porin n=1 Tax=Meridianimarinicoccus roseus TaxID=2072018 RepID=A0A2V2LFI2_9RHOB|nr:hypothetical protein [Meridianimarinicoccus roseus]PWR04195.1 hypothetical protein DKT77_02555 [Meridianimarinicoccus roseus]